MTEHSDARREPDAIAFGERFPAVYDRLRSLAAIFLRSERGDHTLEATALVHEAYLRMAPQGRTCASEEEFLSIAAAQMRHVLVDHARRTNAVKRNGGERPVTLDTSMLGVPGGSSRVIDLVEVDDALRRLEALEPRQSQLVELHLFGGMSVERASAMLGLSPRTGFNDWRMARAWLMNQLGG